MIAPPRSAYLHIPFCHKRCFYCDFSIIPIGDSAEAQVSPGINSINAYLALLHKEILIASSQSPDRGVRKSRFYVIRKTSMPAALVEIGFVTGMYDAYLLRQKVYRDKMSFAIAKGILNYLKVSN